MHRCHFEKKKIERFHLKSNNQKVTILNYDKHFQNINDYVMQNHPNNLFIYTNLNQSKYSKNLILKKISKYIIIKSKVR